MKQKTKKPLLVLGAVATLSSQLSTDMALIAYASAKTPMMMSNTQMTFTQLVGIQDVRGYYHLKNVSKQNIPAVEILKGSSGDVLTTSFTLTKEAVAYLNFNLTLAGPSDSRVVIKINGQEYLQETVGRGKLSEASFFHLEEGDNLVEVEYHVGSANEVLPSESWFKLDNMVLTTQETPTRPMEYRVKGESDWQIYDDQVGVPASLTSKGETLPLEVRYKDTLETVDVTLTTPKPYAPLLIAEDDGRFYLNHFNMVANEYKSVSVRFNKGKWQAYKWGMLLELINNECLVDVKVVNEYDEELILPTQRYIYPEGYQSVTGQGDSAQQPDYIKPLISRVNHQYGLLKTHEDIRFSVSTNANGGSDITTTEWSTDGINWTPFNREIDLKFTVAGDYTLSVRATNEDGLVSDVYQQELSITEAVAPIIEELTFLETELYVGGEYEPHWQVRHDEGTRLNRLEWGGDYDTMFDTPGEKTITLKAQDTRGLWSNTVSYTFTVLPANKPVIQSIWANETDFIVGDHYEFDYKVFLQDADTEIVDVFWSGDYETAFDTPGEKTVTLEVQDNRGIWSDVASYTFTVREAKAPEITKIAFEETLNQGDNPQYYQHGNYTPTFEVNYDGQADLKQFEWGGDDLETLFDTAGEKTITLRVQDSRGNWSDVTSYTFDVIPGDKPVVKDFRLEGTDFIVGSTYDFDYELVVMPGTFVSDMEWGGDYDTAFDTPGQKTVTLRVMDSRGVWSDTVSVTFTVREQRAPIIQESSKPNVFVEGEEIKLNYEVICDDKVYHKPEWIEWLSGYPLVNTPGTHQATFRVEDSMGLWSEPYTITYVVTPKAVAPTLTFASDVLQVPYGSALTSIYKQGVTINKGTAETVKYGAYQDTFDPYQVGKQKVKYLIKYTENGVEKRKYVYRYIEVLAQEPTLNFSSSVLRVPYGSTLTSIYKKGVTIDKGSASTVKYAAYQNTFNPTKVGKQKVKYLVKYTENGVEKRKYVYRYIEVLSKAPTLNFSSSVLKVKKGTPLTSIYKKGVTVDKGSALTVKYAAYQNTFNPNKIGKQKVKYLIKYTENGVEKRAYAYRYIEVVK